LRLFVPKPGLKVAKFIPKAVCPDLCPVVTCGAGAAMSSNDVAKPDVGAAPHKARGARARWSILADAIKRKQG